MLNQMEMKYITDLLYNHDCVIIPNFGGFVSSYASANIETGKSLFQPPHRKILFNSRLSSNDGILANHIANTQNVSYDTAMRVIHRFVDNCNKEMDAEKKVRFNGIGLLSKDENGNIQFVQDNTMNYLPDAFGLTTFNSPMIYREEGIRKIEQKIKNSPAISVRARKWAALKWAAVLVPLLAIGTWGYLNRTLLENKYEEFSIYFKPLSDDPTISNTMTAEELENQILKNQETTDQYHVNESSLIPDIGLLDSDDIQTELEESGLLNDSYEPESTDNSLQETLTEQTSFEFQVITGSFKSYANAEEHYNELKTMGLKPVMAGKNRYDYYRVAAFSTNNRQSAIQKLKEVRSEDFHDAWLLANH